MLHRYVLQGTIGAGGMATVHFGKLMGAAGFSRVVAIKRLHPHLCTDPEVRAMFIDEARLSSRIESAHVVRTLDVIEDTDATGEGSVALVMEYVLGSSLSRALHAAAKKPIPVDVAIAIHIDVLRGLHAAHEARGPDGLPLGIVHRDVSPQNVLVGADGVARLIDFGIAKATRRLVQTETGMMKGKQQYMAPEQLLGEPVTREADIYSTAVMLWQTLTGAPLFAPDSEGIAVRVSSDVSSPPSSRREGVPAELDRAVLQALSRRPERRPATALAFADALAKAVKPASAEAVSTWLEDVAWESLEMAREHVRKIETSHDGYAAMQAAIGTPPPASRAMQEEATAEATVREVASAPAPSDPPRRLRRGLPFAAALLLIMGGAVFAAGLSSSRSRASALPSVASSTEAPRSTTATVDATAPESEPITATPATPLRDEPPKPPSRRPGRSPGGGIAPSRSASCSPPYTFDHAGRKIFNPNCF